MKPMLPPNSQGFNGVAYIPGGANRETRCLAKRKLFADRASRVLDLLELEPDLSIRIETSRPILARFGEKFGDFVNFADVLMC